MLPRLPKGFPDVASERSAGLEQSTLVMGLATTVIAVTASHSVLDTSRVPTHRRCVICLGKCITLLISLHGCVYLASHFGEEEMRWCPR